MSQAEIDHRMSCSFGAGNCLVMTPALKIVWASDAYRQATLLWRQNVRGMGMFDVFPDNPSDRDCDGVNKLRASLDRVLDRGTPDRMGIQRYDVRDHLSGDGRWIEKYWAPVNRPIFGRGSQEVEYLLHEVTDVSPLVRLRSVLREEEIVSREQRESLHGMLREARARGKKLESALSAVEEICAATASGDAEDDVMEVASALAGEAGVKMVPTDLRAGARVPVSGLYRAFHLPGCWCAASFIFREAGARLGVCAHCGDSVVYRYVDQLKDG